ncbi:hypothetical protein [Cardinium endosymbiont of Bemisia tabaci]|uniref:hypothetical protein n=1 Tax=Cardinium endosymbiont of Bemisia tabaci TaxID=672794 RepID=UPI000442D0E1|nr:hypothetical protein [Cardinium endosymbiont of Bemisia tabaci]CDG49798.1 Hypothetical protein CHV_a0490 [Cardinium endosymbiont cBtQ1 of Bemisia tabaci]
MVYKKIGNKIPSLSSLLLAGVLLGSNCNKDKNEKAGEDTTKNTEQGAEGEGAKGSGMKTTSNPGFIAANKEIIKIFFRALGLDYLPLAKQSQSPNQPHVLSLSDNDYSKTNILELVKRLTGSFVKNASAYPIDLRENIAALASVPDNYIRERPRAFALAINEIPLVRNNLANIASQMWEKIDQGEGDAGLKELKEKALDPLSLTLQQGLTKFKASTKFSDASSAKLLDGSQLARFLTDLDKKGKLRGSSAAIGKSYGIPTILSKQFSVCIKNKKQDEACKVNTSSDPSSIGSRGSGLGEDPNSLLVLQGNEGKLPYVPPLLNGTLENRYQQDHFVKYVNDEEDSSIGKVFDKGAGQFGHNGVKDSDISFGTLLFTLFRGNTAYDFLQLTCDKNNTIVLKGIDVNFKKWVDKSEAELADMLYQHIDAQGDLKDLFVIPNLKDLYSKVLPASNVLDEAPALKDVCINILKMLGVSADQSDDLSTVLIPKIEKISVLADKKNELESSDADFNQRFCISFSKKIIDRCNTYTDKFLDVTKSTLQGMIKSHADSLADKAVVKLAEDGKACPTMVTGVIKSSLDYVHDKLKNKHSNANRTYADIASKVKSGTFDIENVRKVYEIQSNKLGSILLTSIAPLLDKKENITEDDLKQIDGLKAEEIDQINKIKQSYQMK